jgi:hypothetical protein
MFTRSFFSKSSAILAAIATLAFTVAPGVPAYASPGQMPASLDTSAPSAIEVSSVQISGPADSAIEVSSLRVSGPAARTAAETCVVASGAEPLQRCAAGAATSR